MFESSRRLGRLGGHDEIGRQGQVDAAADGHSPPDLGDHRLRDPPHD
jgi:hypothetical protein